MLEVTTTGERSQRSARWLGVAMIVIEAAILGYLSGARLFPAVVAVLACAAGITRYRIHLDRTLLHLLCGGIAIGFLLFHMVSPYPFPIEAQFVRTELAHTVARFLICMQLLALVIQREQDRPPPWLAGLGAMSLPFATNMQVPEPTHRMLVFGIVAFVAAAALYCSQARRRVEIAEQTTRWPRAIALATILIVAMFLGGKSAMALLEYEGHIEWFLQDYLGYGSQAIQVGYTGQGRLMDVTALKTLNEDHIALRVYADREPGYLRGRVFDTYRRPDWEHSWSTWTNRLDLGLKPLRPVAAVRGLPAVRQTDRIYQLGETAGGPWSTLNVWTEPPQRGHLFAPLEASYLVIDSDVVARDEHGFLQTDSSDDLLAYSLIVPDAPLQGRRAEAPPESLPPLEPEVDPSVRELADRLFADCTTPREKIERVQQWFRKNFRYRIGIDIPRGADPLTYFLEERPPAHCEFFATGTAVLLRLAGVPARYVTGYVAAEKNELGDYWLARNMDAHAWAEAYDAESRQWVIVESTPSAGIPAPRIDPFRAQLLETSIQWWRMARQNLRTIGFGGVLWNSAKLLWSIPGLVVLLFLAGGLLLRTHRHRPQLPKRPADPRLKSMHAVLKQLDRQARRTGLERQADETLIQFARRIRQADADHRWRAAVADCYGLYATLRFRGRTDPASAEHLQQAISAIPVVSSIKSS